MKTLSVLFLLLLPLFGIAGTLKDALRIYASGDHLTSGHGVLSVSGSIRQRPGKFGQAYLIERRTVNHADPSAFVLGEGASITGKSNRLQLPADGFAALPQIGIKPNSRNTLSFLCRGKGKLTVSLTESGETQLLSEFTVTADFQPCSVLVEPNSDAVTIKFNSTGAIELDELMFDRDISHANTYHAPGKMRGVDVITLDHQLYNPASGAFSCWIKAPWFGTTGIGNAMGILRAVGDTGTKKNTSHFIVAWASLDSTSGKYESTLHNIHRSGKGGLDCGTSFRLSELQDLPVNEWQHLVFNWEAVNGGIEVSVIINGQQKFNNSKGNFLPLQLHELQIGYVNGSYTNGLLDDIAIFSRPLTDAEVATIANSGKSIAELTDLK